MCGKIAVFVGIAFLAFSAIKFTNAAVWTLKRDPTAEPGTCLFKGEDEDIIMDIGVTMHVPNQCQRAFCQRDGSIELASCPIIRYPSNCKSKKDSTKRYPACCHEVTCV